MNDAWMDGWMESIFSFIHHSLLLVSFHIFSCCAVTPICKWIDRIGSDRIGWMAGVNFWKQKWRGEGEGENKKEKNNMMTFLNYDCNVSCMMSAILENESKVTSDHIIPLLKVCHKAWIVRWETWYVLLWLIDVSNMFLVFDTSSWTQSTTRRIVFLNEYLGCCLLLDLNKVLVYIESMSPAHATYDTK